jgi:hypothetical protein
MPDKFQGGGYVESIASAIVVALDHGLGAGRDLPPLPQETMRLLDGVRAHAPKELSAHERELGLCPRIRTPSGAQDSPRGRGEGGHRGDGTLPSRKRLVVS